jgi:hypothetical protein
MRFQARESPLELLTAVRDVARHALPHAPAAVTQRVWDATRPDAGHPGAPRAHSIAQRLGLPWQQVLEIALGPRNDAWRSLTHAQSDKGRKGLTLDAVIAAIRQAALRLGKTGIDRSDYRAAREQIIAASQRARGGRGRRAARAIPELTQVEEVLSQHRLEWADALQHAGLRTPERHRERGLSPIEAVRAFADDLAALPRDRAQLCKWAARSRLAITRPTTEQARLAVAAVEQERAAAGFAPLPIASPDAHVHVTPPQYAVDTRARTRRKDWDRESLLAGMARAVTLLDPGKQLDQRTLKRLAKDTRNSGSPPTPRSIANSAPTTPTRPSRAGAAKPTNAPARPPTIFRDDRRPSTRSSTLRPPTPRNPAH